MALTSLFYRNTGTAKTTMAGHLRGGPALFFTLLDSLVAKHLEVFGVGIPDQAV